MGIEQRPYGRSGIYVGALGLGTGQIGAMDRQDASHLLDAAYEMGIRLFDTAPSYGDAERTLGAWMGSRRSQIVVSTKLGYGVPGVADWSGACISGGIELALRQLKTDWLDIVHLHSCSTDTLQRDEVMWALLQARDAGKVRAIAYSGENAALRHAAGDSRFDGLMASFNLCDQRVADDVITPMGTRGFIAKRPMANAPWRFAAQPLGDYAEAYWLRWQRLALRDSGMNWGELALRFAAWQPGVAAIVLGSGRIDNLRAAVEWVGRGPLPLAMSEEFRARFRACDQDWVGQL